MPHSCTGMMTGHAVMHRDDESCRVLMSHAWYGDDESCMVW